MRNRHLCSTFDTRSYVFGVSSVVNWIVEDPHKRKSLLYSWQNRGSRLYNRFTNITALLLFTWKYNNIYLQYRKYLYEKSVFSQLRFVFFFCYGWGSCIAYELRGRSLYRCWWCWKVITTVVRIDTYYIIYYYYYWKIDDYWTLIIRK